MGKRIGSIVLVLAMLIAALPAAYAAEPQEFPTAGLEIRVDGNYEVGGWISATPSATYRAGSGTVEWNSSTKTLTLNNATIPAPTALGSFTQTALGDGAALHFNTGWNTLDFTFQNVDGQYVAHSAVGKPCARRSHKIQDAPIHDALRPCHFGRASI